MAWEGPPLQPIALPQGWAFMPTVQGFGEPPTKRNPKCVAHPVRELQSLHIQVLWSQERRLSAAPQATTMLDSSALSPHWSTAAFRSAHVGMRVRSGACRTPSVAAQSPLHPLHWQRFEVTPGAGENWEEGATWLGAWALQHVVSPYTDLHRPFQDDESKLPKLMFKWNFIPKQHFLKQTLWCVY